MASQFRRRRPAIWRNERGSFVVEGSLLWPIVLVLTVAVVFFGIYVYSQSMLYIRASAVAGKSAYVWDNSGKNVQTGAFSITEYDGLYWRIFDDGASLFSAFMGGGAPGIQYSIDGSAPANSLPTVKMSHAVPFLPRSREGKLTYTNIVIDRKVTVQMSGPFHAPSFAEFFIGKRGLRASASSRVAEPAEYIRTIDMTRKYLTAIKDKIGLREINDALDTFRKRKSSEQEKLAFNTHAEAVNYLQQTVKGRTARRETKEVGYWRLIDALDKEEIAHQAYLGGKKLDSDMKFQLQKDAELMRSGKLRGVVWHFYRRSSNGSIGPSDDLRQELARNGIVVVVHE